MHYFIILCVLVITVVLILDIVRMHKARKQVNEYKYKIFNWMNVITILSVILLLFSSTGSLIIYLRSHQEIFLSSSYVFLIAAIQLIIPSLSNNYLCDTGVWYWGQLYKWNSIESYTWSSDEQYVVFKMKKKFLGIESELRFKIKEYLSEEVNLEVLSRYNKLDLSGLGDGGDLLRISNANSITHLWNIKLIFA